MEYPRIKIECDGRKTELYINDEKVENIRTLNFESTEGLMPICNFSKNAMKLAGIEHKRNLKR